MSLLFWRHREDKLDERVAGARQRAEEAGTEMRISRERARDRREKVVTPMRRRGDDNQFADLLRHSLQLGYRNENGNTA